MNCLCWQEYFTVIGLIAYFWREIGITFCVDFVNFEFTVILPLIWVLNSKWSYLTVKQENYCKCKFLLCIVYRILPVKCLCVLWFRSYYFQRKWAKIGLFRWGMLPFGNLTFERKCPELLLDKYEPRHEKTCFCHMRTTKPQISLGRLISAFVFTA